MKIAVVMPQFVEFIPTLMQDGVLYISNKYSTAAHRCCCGCGTKIVTPLKPTDWRLIVNAGTVTMTPSIGNWNHPCQSHYFIRKNRVIWASNMSKRQIELGREIDRKAKEKYYRNESLTQATFNPPQRHGQPITGNSGNSFLKKLLRWFNL